VVRSDIMKAMVETLPRSHTTRHQAAAGEFRAVTISAILGYALGVLAFELGLGILIGKAIASVRLHHERASLRA